jgi:P pilus assembly chaperone PapD
MPHPRLSRWACVVTALALCSISSSRAQESDPKLTGIDFILDAYVRDGEVYYRALKADRPVIIDVVTDIDALAPLAVS